MDLPGVAMTLSPLGMETGSSPGLPLAAIDHAMNATVAGSEKKALQTPGACDICAFTHHYKCHMIFDMILQ